LDVLRSVRVLLSRRINMIQLRNGIRTANIVTSNSLWNERFGRAAHRCEPFVSHGMRLVQWLYSEPFRR